MHKIVQMQKHWPVRPGKSEMQGGVASSVWSCQVHPRCGSSCWPMPLQRNKNMAHISKPTSPYLYGWSGPPGIPSLHQSKDRKQKPQELDWSAQKWVAESGGNVSMCIPVWNSHFSLSTNQRTGRTFKHRMGKTRKEWLRATETYQGRCWRGGRRDWGSWVSPKSRLLYGAICSFRPVVTDRGNAS